MKNYPRRLHPDLCLEVHEAANLLLSLEEDDHRVHLTHTKMRRRDELVLDHSESDPAPRKPKLTEAKQTLRKKTPGPRNL